VISQNGINALGHLFVQGLGVLVVAVAFRPLGALPLEWVVGAMLALGWGNTAIGLVSPRFAADVWSRPAERIVVVALRSAAACGALLLVVVFVPWLSDLASTASGVPVWVWGPMAAIGTFRGLSQITSTIAIRNADHRPAIAAQFAGRVLEMAGVVLALLESSPGLFAAAWIVYPIAQNILLAVRWKSYPDVVPSIAPADGVNRSDFGTNLAAGVTDLVYPALWLWIGGAQTYITFRALSAAISFAVLVPRYWYVVAGTAAAKTRYVSAYTITTAAILAFGYLAIAGQLQDHAGYLFLVPLLANSILAAEFSRLRQLHLRMGLVMEPALAGLGGRLVELALLIAITRFVGAEFAILAFSSQLISAILMIELARRRGLR
jgi:hypothetical protein